MNEQKIWTGTHQRRGKKDKYAHKKNAQHYWPLGECKLKAQRAIITSLLERLPIIKIITSLAWMGSDWSWWECGEHTATLEKFGSFSIKLNTQLPYDPADPLLSMYLEKLKLMFIFWVALFMIFKNQKPSKCPSTNEWTNKQSHIHTWTIAQPWKGVN